MDLSANLTCPLCGRLVAASIPTGPIASVEQLQEDTAYEDLQQIAEATGIYLGALLKEAQEVSASLFEAIPLLEKKYDLCAFCGKRKEKGTGEEKL